jgi:glycosyltransferase involved in cell wall biosynthesis
MFDHLAFWRADSVVTVSKTTLETARREHPRSAGKLRCILNGIDLYEGSPPSRESSVGLPSKDQRILLVGRFRLVKGHHDALLAMKKVVSKFPNAGLFFAGTGELEGAVAREIAAAQLQNSVFMLGHVADVGSLMRQVDMVIVPSLVEPFGLVAIEAMASEKLVIASNVGGLSEIIEHKKTGVLIEPSNPSQLAENIIYYLENFPERKMIERNALRSYNEKYTSLNMAKNYLNLYDDLNKSAEDICESP